jgi:hypothetical protein
MTALGAIIIASIILYLLVWLIKALVRFRMCNTVDNILRNSSKSDPRVLEDPINGILVGDPAGLKIKIPNGRSTELLWSEIDEIRAFKKDLMTTDLMRLVLNKSGEENYFVIHEEMAGYYDLLEAMQKYLPGFNLTWVLDVAFPAFAANHIVVWKRAATTVSDATPVLPGS